MKLVPVSLLVLLMLAAGCGGGSNSASNTPPPPPPPSGGLSAQVVGLHVNQLTDYPVRVPYGQFRNWDAGGTQWPDIESCQASSGSPSDPCFSWGDLDTELSNLKAAGVNDILYTLSRTPPWASQNPTDPNCNYFALGPADVGACHPPVDLNPDGSGANQIWKNWITALASRVNDSSYLQSHAHVKYWEIWNEFYRSTTIENFSGPLSWQGTYNQLVRLTEDARCIITGKGVIHNFPSAGQSTACKLTAIDANALIVAPSATLDKTGIDAARNFLYCDNSPLATCTVGNAGAQAVDIIAPHMYATSSTPEAVVKDQLPAFLGVLQSAELQKPLWNGEGSWGRISSSNSIWQQDANARAGFIPRFFALYLSAGVQRIYWYSYDTQTGQLFDPTSGQLRQPEASAWTTTYGWLLNAVPSHTPFCQANGTIYSCDFSKSGSYVARLVWDSQYGQNCSQMADPIVCGATSYSVPSQFNKDWVDVTGQTHPAAGTVFIGANPVLLEGS